MTALERVKKGVQELHAKYGDVDISSDVFRANVLDIIDSEAKRGDWVPVTEALPEEGGFYDVTFENYQGERDIFRAYYDTKKGFSWHKERITAWMPRPQPWRGE